MHICVYVTENLRFTILITESENFVAGNVLFSNMQYWKHQQSSIMLMHYVWKMNLTEKFKKLNTEQLVEEGNYGI